MMDAFSSSTVAAARSAGGQRLRTGEIWSAAAFTMSAERAILNITPGKR